LYVINYFYDNEEATASRAVFSLQGKDMSLNLPTSSAPTLRIGFKDVPPELLKAFSGHYQNKLLSADMKSSFDEGCSGHLAYHRSMNSLLFPVFGEQVSSVGTYSVTVHAKADEAVKTYRIRLKQPDFRSPEIHIRYNPALEQQEWLHIYDALLEKLICAYRIAFPARIPYPHRRKLTCGAW
jgi:hypothetical protein